MDFRILGFNFTTVRVTIYEFRKEFLVIRYTIGFEPLEDPESPTPKSSIESWRLGRPTYV